MKKFTILLVLVLFCLPVIVTAETITVDLSTATLEELQEAQQQIANQISVLRAAQSASVESVELSGSGTAIVSDVVIPFSPSRVILQADGDVTATLTGGSYDHSFDATEYNVTFFAEEGTYTLLIETEGAWSFVVEPIADGGSLPMSGTGPYVSDFIELSSPMIVTVTGAPGTMTSYLSNFIVKLRHQYENISSWTGDSLTNELFSSSSETFTADVILNPTDGRTEYCISVQCDPGVEWSIIPQ